MKQGRIEINWNRDWLYCQENNPDAAQRKCSEKKFNRVCLPHNNKILPLNYFSEHDYQFVSWYRKHFSLPAGSKGKRIFVDFGGVMMSAGVFINGHKAGDHKGGYVPFSVDVTDYVMTGRKEDNVLAVRVDSRLDPKIPPCGHVMDYMTFGGIYRDVTLRIVNPCHIESIFAHAADVLKPRKRLNVDVELAADGSELNDAKIEVDLLDPSGRCVATETGAAPKCRNVSASLSSNCYKKQENNLLLTAQSSSPSGRGLGVRVGEAIRVSLTDLKGIKLWTLDDPVLYSVKVRLTARGKTIDETSARFGFRQAEFTKQGPFLLNGRPIKLIGLNRHQNYPYIGGAAPARLQRRDADILKYELGCHIVRTSHYPQSPHFIDRCDEIGLLVFEEIPGWGHIGDKKWQDLACRDVEVMIRRDRNHPSIILWGVRINESGDDHDFYARTNALARELDPSRQTGGVRNMRGSELLEDVYTNNDFSYAPGKPPILEPETTPYFITEYIGAHLDARRTAGSTHLAEHAMAQAEVQNAIHGHPMIAGGIGWCAFDYHSQDWITVDGIQPWGVSDIFRYPKFAAYFYESQIDPKTRPVLRVATGWRVGDQASFDPNEKVMSGGHDTGLVVFTNCSSVDVYVGKEKKGSFLPDDKNYPHLPYPPVICAGMGMVWGPGWKELRVVGRIGRRVVAEQRFPARNGATKLLMDIDDKQLDADGSDMTRILCRHTDVYGNLLPHSHVAVSLAVTGPATLVGENPLSLSGGVAAVYLRAGERAGSAIITAKAQGFPVQTAKVRIRI